jgi:hypothetical protein
MVDETIIGGPFVRYVPDPETIFMVVEKVGEEEFVRAFCQRVLWDRWGRFTVGAHSHEVMCSEPGFAPVEWIFVATGFRPAPWSRPFTA